jgi:hypothetical protein
MEGLKGLLKGGVSMKLLMEMLRERVKKELEELGNFSIYKKRKYKFYRTMKEKKISIYQMIKEIGKVKTNLISYTIILTPFQKIPTQKLSEIAEKYEKEFYIEKKIYITPSVFDDAIYIDLYYPFEINLLLKIINELKK